MFVLFTTTSTKSRKHLLTYSPAACFLLSPPQR